MVDLFSRCVVGWAIKAKMTAQFVTYALIIAVWRRGNGNSRGLLDLLDELQKLDRRKQVELLGNAHVHQIGEFFHSEHREIARLAAVDEYPACLPGCKLADIVVARGHRHQRVGFSDQMLVG